MNNFFEFKNFYDGSAAAYSDYNCDDNDHARL
jgi:hypothetical protein